jgi:methylated-DNA-protein-cysteine methyltransferase-like protein
MPRSPSSRTRTVIEADEFYRTVYEIVRRIPPGRVCTYGEKIKKEMFKFLAESRTSGYIAKLAERPRNSRLVGQALKHLAPRLASPFIDPAEPERGSNPDFVPWHRVVNSAGVISPRGSTRAVLRQADMLRDEGVRVVEGPRDEGGGAAGAGGGEYFGLAGVEGGRVRLSEFGWFPALPDVQHDPRDG